MSDSDKNTENSDLSQTRICVERILPEHEEHVRSIRESGLHHDDQQKLMAAFYARKLWPADSKIRIGFLSDGKKIRRTTMAELQHGKEHEPVDPLQKNSYKVPVVEMVKKVVRERIIPLVNLDIDFVDNPKDANVRVDFKPDGGAWSLVGTDHAKHKSGATINLGWFDVPTTMHEFGHMLGMIHEHQNPRGDTIQWNRKNVFMWASQTQGWDKKTTIKNILNKYKLNAINGSSFDPNSIMLYFFPAWLTTNHVGTHQNLRFSGLDVEWITKMYPNGPESPTKFYRAVYDESLEESIAQSKAEAKGEYGTGNYNYLIYLIVGILIVAFILWRAKRKRYE